MTRIYNEDFRKALTEISSRVPHINSPIERARIVEWCLRLAEIPSDDIVNAKKRNNYIQLLKIMIRGKRLSGIFKQSPGKRILSLGESIRNEIAERYSELPDCGPIRPIFTRETPDGSAYIAINKISDSGLLCFMSVSPNQLAIDLDKNE